MSKDATFIEELQGHPSTVGFDVGSSSDGEDIVNNDQMNMEQDNEGVDNEDENISSRDAEPY